MIQVNAGATAAIAAAAAQRRAQEEEEQMTGYSSDDLDGWEFKILRSATSSFKHREKLQAALAEEAENGWELVEKFDDTRVRLKRSVDRRNSDSMSDVDPYRTWAGTDPNKLALRVLAIIFGTLALIGIGVALAVNAG